MTIIPFVLYTLPNIIPPFLFPFLVCAGMSLSTTSSFLFPRTSLFYLLLLSLSLSHLFSCLFFVFTLYLLPCIVIVLRTPSILSSSLPTFPSNFLPFLIVVSFFRHFPTANPFPTLSSLSPLSLFPRPSPFPSSLLFPPPPPPPNLVQVTAFACDPER